MTLARRTFLSFTTLVAATRPAFAALDAVPASPKLPPMKTVKLFGTAIRYLEIGTPGAKPTLVLLHGLGSSAAGDWGQVALDLAKTHHVVAPDQLGFGQSDKPFITYGIQTWVDFLGEFLRETLVKRGVTEFALMGESLGGWIAAQYTVAAAQALFTSGMPLVVMPLDSTALRLDDQKRAAIFSHGSTLTDALTLMYEQWTHAAQPWVSETPTLFDVMPVAYVLEPALCPTVPLHIAIDAAGFTREVPGTPNADVCLRGDKPAVFDRLMRALLR